MAYRANLIARLDELGADFVIQSPHDPAFSPGLACAVENQDELVREVDAIGEKPDAAVRGVGDQASMHR